LGSGTFFTTAILKDAVVAMEGAMCLLSRFEHLLSEERFTANLIAAHGAILVLVLASLVLRRLLTHGGDGLIRWTGARGFDAVGKEATRQGHTLLFWLTLGAIVLTLAGSGVYHFSGRDIRVDMRTWYENLTPEEILQLGLSLGEIVGLAIVTWIGVRIVRRLRAFAEISAVQRLGGEGNAEALHRWFTLFERFGVASVRLAAVWGIGHLLGLGTLADKVVGFILSLITILAVARLLTLGWDALSNTARAIGDKQLGNSRFSRYWERVTRLLPFFQRCFEAAVYVTAASLCVRQLLPTARVIDPNEVDLFKRLDHFGYGVVECIGIFCVTRVLIELAQVLLNEAFGTHAEDKPADQKGKTLVPLLCSVCQYAFYIGSGIMMLGRLGVDTTPILAGAGILGLAVGLGAQSLVSDIVSGFFILFENQYLVGDYINVNGMSGTVEAVGIRLTQLRDGKGRQHIIPNGQIKGVISYSKGYILAVVDIKLPSSTDLESLFRTMKEVGRRLKQTRDEVLEETVLHGIVDWSPSDMTVRAVTRVKPGTHGIMQNEYRRIFKELYDRAKEATKPALAA
jgi:small conductance mechanosensitive channel